MVIEGLVMVALGFVQSLFDLLGDAVNLLPGGGSVAGGIIVGYGWLNSFLPVAETVAGIVFLLSLYLWLFGYRMIREAWSLVPIIGGKSQVPGIESSVVPVVGWAQVGIWLMVGTWLARWWRADRQVGTEAYVGWRGHGKTMLAVERARRLAVRRKCPLIANIWVRDDPGLTVERIPLGTTKGSKSAGMDMDWLIDRLWMLKEQKSGAVVLLDEAGVLFSAREWQRFPPELGYLIAQGRRLRVDLVYTSQFIDQVDKVLREMTEVAHKVRAWPAPTVLGRETGRRPLIMWTSSYRPSAVDQAEKRLGRSWMWYRRRRERDYDTDEFVLPMRYRTVAPGVISGEPAAVGAARAAAAGGTGG